MLVTRQNPLLAFEHGPGFDSPGFDGVRVWDRDRVKVIVWVKVRVWVRVRVGINGPSFDK